MSPNLSISITLFTTLHTVKKLPKSSPFKTNPGHVVLTPPLHHSSFLPCFFFLRFPLVSSLHLESAIIGIHASMKSQKQFFQLMQLLTRSFGIQTPKDGVSLHHYIDPYCILQIEPFLLEVNWMCAYMSILSYANIAVCRMHAYFWATLGEPRLWTSLTHPPASSLLCPGVQASDLNSKQIQVEDERNWKSQGMCLDCQEVCWLSVFRSSDAFSKVFPKPSDFDSKRVPPHNHEHPKTLPVVILLIFQTSMTLPWCLEGCLRSCSLRKPAVMIPAGSAKSPMPPKGTNKAAMEETSKAHKISTFGEWTLQTTHFNGFLQKDTLKFKTDNPKS